MRAAVIVSLFLRGNVVRNNMLVPFLQSGGVNERSMGGLDAFVLLSTWGFDVSGHFVVVSCCFKLTVSYSWCF